MTESFRPHWFGDFELLKPLGAGGMAEVFLARTTGAQGFEKVVVVKRMLSRLIKDQRFVQMFIDEAKVAVFLQHANVVQILSLEEHRGRPFIVMEYVHGQDLYAVLRQTRRRRSELPADFVIHCVVEMLKGLGYAHTATGPDGRPLNLIHRDVTPSNVFVSFSGEVKLGDFGVAHSVGQVQSSEVRGKISYLAPEALRGQELDPRADLFGAGIVLWEALAQRRLFRGDNAKEVLDQIRKRVPEPPSAHNPRVPPDLDLITAKALEKDPDKRFQSAQEFEEALSDYLFVRRLRWTRQRIASVMQVQFPDQSAPLVLPPPTARAVQVFEREHVDMSDMTADEVRAALDGLEEIPSQPPGSDISETTWPESIDEEPTAVLGDEEKRLERDRFAAELLLLHLDSQTQPEPADVEHCLELMTYHPGTVAGLGVVGEWYLSRDELAQLLYWDALRAWSEPNCTPVTEAPFATVSVTRLVYELTVRRTSGLVVFEDAHGTQRRGLYLEEGVPLYVSSTDPQDGAPVVLRKHGIIDASTLFHALVQVIGDRMFIDQSMVATKGVETTAEVEQVFSAMIRARMFAPFAWSGGRFRVYADVAPPIRPMAKSSSLLAVLVRAVRRMMTLEELQVALQMRGQRAVVLAEGREAHIAALRLKDDELPVIQAIDGGSTLPKVLERADAESSLDALHKALSVLYVLGETRIAELL